MAAQEKLAASSPAGDIQPSLVARLMDFIGRDVRPGDRVDDGRHDERRRLIAEVFDWQYRAIEPYRRLCDARGVTPMTVSDWRQIPPVPVAAFKTERLAVAPPVEIFRSSGTSGAARSVHYHPFPELYVAAIDRTFAAHCLPLAVVDGSRRCSMLSLVPDRRDVPDSSLGFMIEHVRTTYGDSSSVTAIGPGGVAVARANAWAEQLVESGRPGTIVSTAFALVEWLDALPIGAWHLPAGTTLFETGGFKGRAREIERSELLAWVHDRLGVESHCVVREYGMTELTGHFYTDVLRGGDGDVFTVPHFMEVRLLDPSSLREVDSGSPGLICVLDLANAGSALHLLTEDVGASCAGGFRWLGRAAETELRGCSLTAEELARGVL